MEADQIRALFNRIAPVYDGLNDWLSLGLHRIWKQMTVQWSGAQAGHTCLDVCCGSGDLALLLSRQVGPTGQVFGVDFAAAQLAIAQTRYQARSQTACLYPLAPVTWQEADALNLPFADNTFDAATMGYGLRNVTNISLALQELQRVLKPGAKAAILDFHRSPDPQTYAFEQWYLKHLVVPLAERFGLAAEYAYIQSSLDKFPIGVEQVNLAQQVGFSTAIHYPIAGDTMGVLVITKSSR